MNINFKTHFPWPGVDGKPEETDFQAKLEACLSFPKDPQGWRPKKHTIRRVNKPRFRAGMQLVFTTGGRFKPKAFGVTECVSVQQVKMNLQPLAKLDGAAGLGIWIDGKPIEYGALEALANNDGLGEWQFTKWFLLDVITHGPGTYELVHWTDLRY